MNQDQETLHIIVNPVAGHGQGPHFVEENVIPILRHLLIPYQIHTTSSPGDAGNIGQYLTRSFDGGATIRLAIVGGDGTFHELIEGVQDVTGIKWEVVLLPFGTANALFSSLFPPSTPLSPSSLDLISSMPFPLSDGIQHQLSSLFSYLTKSPSINLPITQTTLSTKAAICEKFSSHVVLSTSLHAAILHDSEALRESHPGTERFKIAAAQNASKLFYANVNLSSNSQAPSDVEQWDPNSQEWTRPFTISNSVSTKDDNHKEGSAEWYVKGPFSYFLSTSTVDRLEPTFMISPFTNLKSEGDQFIYVTMIRPFRDRFIPSSKIEERKDNLSKRAFEIVGSAYNAGSHVDLTYPASQAVVEGDDSRNGNGLETKGEGEPVVEVFRCTSFNWNPSIEQKSEGWEQGNNRLVCADGALHSIPEGGSAEVELRTQEKDTGFFVFA
ncbi:uncharacterized protein IL334_006069 [Kwoniella shivajii]|uniref:DAGKc domain-containing protein n=1 Tax=Kwoniella shivajii TaxID=564305 RepID=A0ABZ1D4W4_9TREE|nr:hypothetical protein IL334_006069 [Kwoniella shivajii]